jgi:hypothetical protein
VRPLRVRQGRTRSSKREVNNFIKKDIMGDTETKVMSVIRGEMN